MNFCGWGGPTALGGDSILNLGLSAEAGMGRAVGPPEAGRLGAVWMSGVNRAWAEAPRYPGPGASVCAKASSFAKASEDTVGGHGWRDVSPFGETKRAGALARGRPLRSRD